MRGVQVSQHLPDPVEHLWSSWRWFCLCSTDHHGWKVSRRRGPTDHKNYFKNTKIIESNKKKKRETNKPNPKTLQSTPQTQTLNLLVFSDFAASQVPTSKPNLGAPELFGDLGVRQFALCQHHLQQKAEESKKPGRLWLKKGIPQKTIAKFCLRSQNKYTINRLLCLKKNKLYKRHLSKAEHTKTP